MIKTQDNSTLDGKCDKIDGLGFLFFLKMLDHIIVLTLFYATTNSF
jgi:hypothetical protein